MCLVVSYMRLMRTIVLLNLEVSFPNSQIASLLGIELGKLDASAQNISLKPGPQVTFYQVAYI